MEHNNFVLREKVWHYVGNCLNAEQTAADFAAMLEEFPEPSYKWLDERQPHEQPGPGTWVLELQNDQETHFSFNLARLEELFLADLTTELENLVTEGFQRHNLGDGAYVDRVWKATVEYRELSASYPVRITYAVYWRVSE